MLADSSFKNGFFVYSQLFFVLLALILINFTPEKDVVFWVDMPFQALKWAILGYFGILALIYLQAKLLTLIRKDRFKTLWLFLLNLELLCYLSFYHFGLGAQRFFMQGILASFHTPFALISLMLYFFALGWGHLWQNHFHMHRSWSGTLKSSWQQVLFLFPTCFPFIIISFLLDILESFSTGPNQEAILLALFFCLTACSLVFLPPFMVFCWGCRPLQRLDLQTQLEKRCSSLHFKHAGLKIWPIMQNAFTAGIIGVLPAFRYILFTPALLARLHKEEIEAILIHEIGHNRYKHLLFYPFILTGILILSALTLSLLENNLPVAFLEKASDFTLILGLFGMYALLLGLYFRCIFGFFSRLFERQADLYIFESSFDPFYMIQALDRLGVVTGFTHSQPSWHHFSLQERIRFLYQAIEKPAIILHHHRRVKQWLLIYFSALCLGAMILYTQLIL